MRLNRFVKLLVVCGLVVCFPTRSSATPYGANVRNTSGSTWEFVLNEAADSVTVLRDGGNAVNLGALAAGRYTFDMTGFSTFDVKVQKAAPTAWTTLYGAGNAFTNFTFPTGVAINTNPSNLAYFGTVYIGNGTTTATQAGRAQGDGVYALTGNMVGVDLANNFAVVADPNDTSQAKAPNWTVAGSNNSPWRMSLDASGNIIAADWADANGGIKWASRDLTTGGPLLIHEDGIRPLLGNSPDGLSGPEVHGSIAAKVYTTGSVGNNLVAYGMDEDFDLDGETLITASSGNHVWKWNVGNVANTDPNGGYDQPPSLVINASNIPRTTDSRQNFLNLNIGVSAGMHYDSTFNKWYLVEPRDAGDQGCIAIVTPDGVDGNSPTLNWSSLQFSIDNNLDGNATFPTTPFGDSRDIQDMFRRVRDVSITPDHKYMVLNRSVYTAANLGLSDGDVIIVPLDANGIPNIQVSGGQITNVQTIQLVGNTAAHGTGAQLEFDAAGNLYVADSGNNTTTLVVSQLVQVFSPGGNWIATTSSNGTFNLLPLVVGVPGDYNGNGVVDGGDYVLWRDGGPLQNEVATLGSNTPEDYTEWRARFGNTSGSGSSLGGSTVPEPSTFLLAGLALLTFGTCRKRQA